MGSYLQNQLFELCEFSKDQKWDLKYRASRDGFKSTDFHSHCDGIANTLTVIKAKSGNIFGGFTEQEWRSNSEWITNPITNYGNRSLCYINLVILIIIYFSFSLIF